MRRLALLPLLAVAGCGSTAPPRPASHPVEALAVCAAAPLGHGRPGACTPASARGPVLPQARRGGIQIVDLSNNDPAYNMHPMARYGIKGVWLKVQEGTGYHDRTFAPMVHAARAARIPVGGYDFVRDYSSGEARLFVARLKAAGTCTGRNTLPPVLDIEAGHAYRSGVQAMVNVVGRSCGRVAIYTGLWYWNPYLGRWWPRGVSAWISGYPRIIGSANYARVDVHQFSDKGYNGSFSADLSRWLGSTAAYRRYVGGAKPRPHHSRGYLRARDNRHLHALLYERGRTRRHLLSARCRVRRPRARCRALLRHGAQVNAEINLLRHRRYH